MQNKKWMIPLVIMCAITILSLQAACVTGRRTLDLPVTAHDVPAATKGRVYIEAVADDRRFENHPSDPSIPSIDGDVTKLSAEQKGQMIGRQRNSFGKAMGDIALTQGDSVTKRVRLLVEQGLARSGYGVSADPSATDKMMVSVRQFWAWATPGVFALTFEARISCEFSVTDPSGTHVVIVNGYGLNHGQFAKDVNWQEAYDPAFEDFLANFVVQLSGMGIRGPVP